jgi:retinol-binding protein 3
MPARPRRAPLHRSFASLALAALLSVAPATVVTSQYAAAEDAAADKPPAAKLQLPDTDAGRCVTAFLEMFADPTPERVTAFETQYRSPKRLAETGMDERIARSRSLHDDLGRLTLREVLSVAPDSISIAADSDRGRSLKVEFLFDSEQGGKLDRIGIDMACGPGAMLRSALLSPDARKELVAAVAKTIADGYVYPEVGRKMAEAVREKLAAGGYDRIEDDADLSRQLTEDMRAVSNDRHLGVRPEAPRPDRPGGPSERDIAGDNYAFRKVEVLPGNIGYIRFDAFVEDQAAYATASAALAFLANCDALIFDLRNNGGGSPESIRYITSYLFDKPTHLNDMIDRDGKIVEEYWTLETVPGRRFAPDLPVFVLTSGRTFSGAEEFSYNLQNLKRATIVGETTGGGAHPVRGVRVSDRIVVALPYQRACNPISKKNWEGTGVEPDVKTPAEEALDRAVELAKKAVAAGR